MKKIIAICSIGLAIAGVIATVVEEDPKEVEANWEISQEVRDKTYDEVFGVDNGTDFVPGYYEPVYEIYDDIPLSTEQQLYVSDLCDRYNICLELVYSLMFHESTFNELAENGNCKGILQINTSCHDINNPFDFYENVEVGVRYLDDLFRQYEEVDLVLGIWHGESKAFENYESGEISKYVREVLSLSAEYERQHGK